MANPKVLSFHDVLLRKNGAPHPMQLFEMRLLTLAVPWREPRPLMVLSLLNHL